MSEQVEQMDVLERLTADDYQYKYGFESPIEEEIVPPGLNEGIIRTISQKKGEPEWMLQWRLQAFRYWQQLKEPHWANVHYEPIDYQAISYYAAPKQAAKPASLDEIDPELRRTFDKLGIPLHEQELLAGVAVDAVLDSVSVATTFRDKLKSLGIIFVR